MAKGCEISVGQQVGSYRIIRHLVGNTYRALHVRNGQRALIEIAAPLEHDGAPDSAWRDLRVQMLRAERLVGSLKHPGIAGVTERGALDDRQPWVATEVPSGIGLHDVIARREMEPTELVALIRDVAEVLAYAHARGVIHRSLTLRSIVLATGARAFPLAVAEWGLDRRDIGLFAAPELSTTAEHDGRADVYSLGVIAFRAASGRFPGDGGVFDVARVPGGLATLIARMLAVSAQERPAAAEVQSLAAALLANSRQLAGPRGDDVVQGAAPRFSKPKWTPNPDVVLTSERASMVSGEIGKKRS